MARKPRVHFPNAFYHVIVRGNQKQDIFLDPRDRHRYLSFLADYKARFQFHLYAYVLMRNHVHMLIEVESIPLSRIMQVLQFRYTQYFNRRYGKVGHLFQGRYTAMVCDKEAYLLELVRYIHLNPVRSSLTPNPEGYPWSSHGNYLGTVKDNLPDVDFVLGQFSASKQNAIRQYKQFVLDGLHLAHEPKYYDLKDQRFLGTNDFVKRLPNVREIEVDYSTHLPIEDIVREVGNLVETTRDRMHSMTRNRKGAFGRSLVAFLARKVSNHKVKEIAAFFRREPMTISQAIIKVEGLLQKDADLARKLSVIERNLIEKRKEKYLISIA